MMLRKFSFEKMLMFCLQLFCGLAFFSISFCLSVPFFVILFLSPLLKGSPLLYDGFVFLAFLVMAVFLFAVNIVFLVYNNKHMGKNRFLMKEILQKVQYGFGWFLIFGLIIFFNCVLWPIILLLIRPVYFHHPRYAILLALILVLISLSIITAVAAIRELKRLITEKNFWVLRSRYQKWIYLSGQINLIYYSVLLLLFLRGLT